MKTKYLPTILTVCLLATLATAGAIKQWSAGETLHAADLNSNFSHIHNLMVGGHGARLVDADVSASAAIAQSKIANLNHYAPKAWVAVMKANSGCASGTPGACTVIGTGPTVVGVSSGIYTVTLGYTATNTSYGVTATALSAGTLSACTAVNLGTTSFSVVCDDLATPSPADVGFTAVIYDND